jgi:glycine cleavage system H protein
VTEGATVIPEQLRYTGEHEWVAAADGRARVGITHYAQDALGDVVFVQLPEIGAEITAGEPVGEIESTKSVSELYAPVTGTVVAVNQAVSDAPEIINSDPYGEGWLFDLEPAEPAAIADLLDADGYRQLTQG